MKIVGLTVAGQSLLSKRYFGEGICLFRSKVRVRTPVARQKVV
jgi:hypothetical protein